jgi:two-component system, cell cycle sensor histidine kinase and response regulator CckA
MSSTAGFSADREGSVEALLAGQNRILEMIATNAPLEEALTSLVLLIESQFEGMLCSIVLLDEDGQHIHHGAAPSLPDTYRKAIDGIRIGAKVGSCGTAMFRGEPVIVTDILEDPLWEDFRALASRHGLRACWSTPIASHLGKILGSFAMYYREPRSPGSTEMQLISIGTRIAGIAIERWQADLERRRAAENYRSLVENLNDVVFSLDAEGRFSYVSPIIEDLSGYTVDEVMGKGFSLFVHPEDLPLLQKSLASTVAGHHAPFECRILEKSGVVRWCRNSMRRVLAGELVVSITGILEDISERKRAEEARQLLASIVQSSTDAIISETVEGVITSWNPGAEALYGYSAEEAIGRSIFILTPPDRFAEVRSLVEKATTGETILQHDIVRVRKDGSKIDVSVTVSPIRNETGTVTQICVLAQDITERKQREQRLREFESVVEGVEEMIAVVDREYRYVIANRAFLRYRGMKKEQVIGKRVAEVLDPEIFEGSIKEKFDECFQGKVVRYELRYRYPELGERDLSVSYFPIEGPDGVSRAALILQDSTERKRAEEALKESEEKFSKAFRQSPMALTISSLKDHRYIEVNETFERLTGWRRAEVIGRTPFDIGFWESPAERVELTKRLLTEGYLRNVEARFRMRDGSIRIGLATAELIDLNGEQCMLAVAADITERQQAEEALRRSEQNYRMFVAQSSEGIFRQDLDAPIPIDLPEEELIYRILHDSYMAECNDALARMYGVASGRDLTGKRLADVLVAGDPRNIQLTRDFIRSGFRIRERESHEVDSQGNPKVFLNSMTGIVEDGKLVRTWGIQRDITEWVRLDEARKNTEIALRNAELRYRTIFEEAVIGIFQTTPNGKLLIANPALARMFGYDSPAELMASVNQRSKQVYVDPEAYREFMRVIERSGSVRDFEIQVYRKDGTIMWLSLSARAVQEHGVVVSHEGMCEDVTERKLLQKQLLQAQKMEAVGSLAGGIAHDFNNVLGVILGQGELLLQKLAPSDGSRRRVEQICQAGKRAASLTEQLLAFSRQQILRPSTLDLNRVVEDFSNMLASLIGEDVKLVRLLDPELGRVSADAGQIEQVLMNLVVNARDAMPRGGTITIQTSNMEMDEAFVQQHAGTKTGSCVVLTVSDTGAGMDEQTASRAFDPFFTTKEVNKGTGLGLSTVYGIVKQSGGHISVESAPGEGARFSIYLPRVKEAATAKNWEKKSAPPARGNETILLVEDAAPLREVTREFLKEAGYAVLEAADAADALETAERYSAEISLLVTDVVLPGINGHALAERLMLRRPGMKVLYISGYTDDVTVRHCVSQSEVAFLGKPFTQDALARKVRDILDAAA